MIVVAIVVAVRLATLDAYALADTTEARYSEIARLMVVSNNWIVPQIEAGLPFWGKPPLSFWLTAISFKLFGFGEFAARLPFYLLTLANTGLIVATAGLISSRESGIVASAIFLTTAIGFILAGTVMTDAALLLATTICLYSFASIVSGSNRPNSQWFFVGLGLGLLAKGPIAIVLVMLPIGAWSLAYKSIPWLYRALPWWRGLLVAVAIAAPWYVLAEMQSPGFLRYFLVGEHWYRFFDSGWSGDLYGKAHAEPRGMIWLFGLAVTLPWSIVALLAAGTCVLRRESRISLSPETGLMLFWTLSPLVFWTMAGNILPTYVLTGLPAFSILLAMWVERRNPAYAALGLIVPALVIGGFSIGAQRRVDIKSQKDLIALHEQTMPDTPLYFFPKATYSAEFYSGGASKSLRDRDALLAFLRTDSAAGVAIRNSHLAQEEQVVSDCLEPVHRFARFSLFRKSSAACTIDPPRTESTAEQIEIATSYSIKTSAASASCPMRCPNPG